MHEPSPWLEDNPDPLTNFNHNETEQIRTAICEPVVFPPANAEADSPVYPGLFKRQPILSRANCTRQ
jgi:hypothetical protein